MLLHIAGQDTSLNRGRYIGGYLGFTVRAGGAASMDHTTLVYLQMTSHLICHTAGFLFLTISC